MMTYIASIKFRERMELIQVNLKSQMKRNKKSDKNVKREVNSSFSPR